jgi:hypothetical protein
VLRYLRISLYTVTFCLILPVWCGARLRNFARQDWWVSPADGHNGGMELRISGGPPLISATFRADRGRLQQLLRNLILTLALPKPVALPPRLFTEKP